MIERRMVMIALGVYAVAVPLAARAQQTQEPARVAVLFFGSPETTGNYLDVFKTRMRELGYVEGRDVVYGNRLEPSRHQAPAEAARYRRCAAMGGRLGAGRPVRAAWMVRASKAVTLAPRSRQVSMTLASSAMLLEPTSVRVP